MLKLMKTDSSSTLPNKSFRLGQDGLIFHYVLLILPFAIKMLIAFLDNKVYFMSSMNKFILLFPGLFNCWIKPRLKTLATATQQSGNRPSRSSSPQFYPGLPHT